MRSRLILLPFADLLACGGGGSDATGPGTTGGGGGGGGTGPVATTAVDMSGDRFSPTAIKVASGATVTWTNSDGHAHNVTFDGAVGSIPNFSTGSQALQMPAAAGTYTYHCTIHGVAMSGSVLVQ
jgi:plastocyanin